MLIAPNVQLYTAYHPIDPAVRLTGVEMAAPITIGNNVRIQAQSGIGRNVKDNEVLQGSPALAYGDYNKSYVYFKNLPKIVKDLNEIEKKVNGNN